MIFTFGKKQPHEEPFPEEWLKILSENVVLYGLLTPEEQARLRQKAHRLIAEKFWEGCAGLLMTDEVRVTIAGQAAMLLLGFDDYHFDELRTILVYPGGFLAVEEDELGIADEYQRNLGESYQGGPIILSWWDARWGGKRLGEINVVLHEFAHKLADLGDPEAGRPPLVGDVLRQRWDKVMAKEYRRFCNDVEKGRPVLLDPYGADSPAEFFGVATEFFFIQADAMKRRHPELYQLLADFYRQDPASRPVSEALLAQSKEAEKDYARHVVEECTVALQHQPDDKELLFDRVRHLREIEDHEAALLDCDRLLELAEDDEDRADVLIERGGILRDVGSDNEALADFNEAITLCPDMTDALSQRASLHAERGEHRESLADLEELLQLDPKDDEALLIRAGIYREQGFFSKAEHDLTLAIGLTPKLPEGYLRRAEVLLDQKKYQSALEDSDKALELEPREAEGWKLRGIARFHLSRLAEALTDLDESLRLDPEDDEAREARETVLRAM